MGKTERLFPIIFGTFFGCCIFGFTCHPSQASKVLTMGSHTHYPQWAHLFSMPVHEILPDWKILSLFHSASNSSPNVKFKWHLCQNTPLTCLLNPWNAYARLPCISLHIITLISLYCNNWFAYLSFTLSGSSTRTMIAFLCYPLPPS